MEYRSFYIKPVGDGCNLRCSYCEHCQPSWELMSDQTVQALLKQACSGTGELSVHFVFTGGEPLLAGGGFFEAFDRLEQPYRTDRIRFSHTVQTNGTLLNDAWCKFFKDHEYALELSIDGSELAHNENRRDSSGDGTYDLLLQKWKLLQRHKLEAKINCTVTARVARHARVVYEKLRELKPRQLHFQPCHDPLSCHSTQPYSLTAEAYGKFLNQIFAFWCGDCLDSQYLAVDQFEHYIRLLIGLGASDCRIQGRCGSYLVVDHDGSVYPCEYYTTEDWCMGNIRQDLSLLFNSDAFRLFIQMAHDLPDDCMSCPYALLCRGGCPRERAYSETRVDNSLCEGLRAFFDTAMPALEELAQKEVSLREQQQT